MAILSIQRDWNGTPAIVRLHTTDSLGDVLSQSYLLINADEISEVNNGAFTWDDSDLVAVTYEGGKGIFALGADGTLVPAGGSTFRSVFELDADDIQDMYTDPIGLIVPMGAGVMTVVKQYTLVYEHGTASFAAGGPILLQYGDDANGAGIPASAELAAATLNGFAADSSVTVAGLSAAGSLADKANTGIFISNKTGAFTTGDGSVKLIVDYTIVTV